MYDVSFVCLLYLLSVVASRRRRPVLALTLYETLVATVRPCLEVVSSATRFVLLEIDVFGSAVGSDDGSDAGSDAGSEDGSGSDVGSGSDDGSGSATDSGTPYSRMLGKFRQTAVISLGRHPKPAQDVPFTTIINSISFASFRILQ